MIRRLFYGLSAGMIVLAAFTVPMPLVDLGPGAAPQIPPLVTIEEVETTAITGPVHLLTVSFGEPTLVDALRSLLDDRRSLDWREDFIPQGIDLDVYLEQQRRVFQTSFDVAAAVGARAAGFEVEARTAPLVGAVLPDGPAAEVLRPGDLVLRVGGDEVTTGEELADRTGQFELGARIELTVLRGGEELDVEVRAGQVRGMEHPGLGVTVGTAVRDVELPFPVELSRTRIGGPSAGLMMALTVYDLLAEEDLVRGRTIAGTGTLTLSGRVGAISGIPEKVAGAEGLGADVMLVPASLEDAAVRARQDPDLRIVGVESFEQALEALREG